MRRTAFQEQEPRKDFYPGGLTPYGYCKVPVEVRVGKKPRYKLAIDPAEAEILRTMYRLYITGSGAMKVAEALTARGFRTRSGHIWDKGAVIQTLQQSAAGGVVRWGVHHRGKLQLPEKWLADTSPVEILWTFEGAQDQHEPPIHSPEQVPHGQYCEGAVRQVLVNAYERDRSARQACITHYGLACAVCGLRFEEKYGTLGAWFIHVHHIIPISELGPDYKLNPIDDLRPVCPNCHAMLHRQRPPLSIEALRAALR